MIKSCLAAILLSLLPGLALAADLPVSSASAPLVAAPPASIWNGFYGGFNVGGAVDSRNTFAGSAPGFGAALLGVPAFRASSSTSGFAGGAQFGYIYQIAGTGLVVGAESDFAYTDLARARPVPGLLAGLSTTYRSSIDGIGTVRGRAGYAFGSVLIYGTGGFAYGIADRQLVSSAPGLPNVARLDARSFDTGYAVGGGVEYALPANLLTDVPRPGAVTVRAEYLHVALAQQTASLTLVGQALTLRMNSSTDLVRAGVNYHF